MTHYAIEVVRLVERASEQYKGGPCWLEGCEDESEWQVTLRIAGPLGWLVTRALVCPDHANGWRAVSD